jgi:hypothetical protein
MRTFWLVAGCVLGLTCVRPVAAQTMVEAGAAGSAAATATTGAKGVGTAIGGAFESLGQTLNQAPAQRVVKVTTPAKSAAKPKKDAVPPPNYEDAAGIEKGMSCEDVARRFGPPAMSFAGEGDARTMSYAGKSGGVQVECESGKVASVDKAR